MDFSNYKFRCSGLGNLMTNSRSKNEILSETAKTYLRDIYIKEVYGRFRDTSSKYTEKGLYTEEDSFNRMQNHYGKLLVKNKETFENDLIKGTPDIILEDRVADAKSSWSIHTFFEADGTNKDYFWQGIGYMNLTERELFDLCYCLNNAPEHQIVDEKNRAMWKRGLAGKEGTPEFDEMESEIDKNMTFDDIPEEKRIRVFQITYDSTAFEQLRVRIYEARAYLNSLNL